MNGNKIALDTSVAISILSGTLSAALSSQEPRHYLLPVPVVGELRYGALNSQRSAQNLTEVERLVSHCQVLEITTSTAEVYARLRLQLKEEGKPIPENDLWIAAFCIEHGVPLANSDSHFATIEGLVSRSL